jgi:3-oxoadipate enol-lactonase
VGRIDLNGFDLAYTDSGAGPPVLLLHAFPLSSAMWAPQVDALAGDWRVVAVDLKGFGGSSAPRDPAAYSMDSYAEEILALTLHLHLDRVTVVGLSMGGYVAFALMRRQPEVVAALVLADTRSEADDDDARARRTKQQEQVREEGTEPVIESLVPALLGSTTRRRRPDLVAHARALMDNPADGYVGALEAMKNRPDSSSLLGSIRVPTLVVVGEEDALTPPETARRTHERIRASRLAELSGAGHLSSLEAPGAFNRALVAFLDEL